MPYSAWSTVDMKISMLRFFSTETSDRAFEEEVMLSGFASAPVKQEGAGVTCSIKQVKLSQLDTITKL
jgi:hypothetical protein